MSAQQQFQLDIFERYYRRGLEGHRAGDSSAARRDFLKAAEVLFKLAASSAGELREVRKRKAQQLLELARSLDASAEAKEAPKPAGRGISAGAGDADGEAEAPRWRVTESPGVRMDEVAGLDDVKALIRKRVIYPFQHPEITRRYRKRVGGGVLLYGPPGTGKTMIAKAIAGEVDAAFFNARCSDIMSKWVGQAEQNIRALFDAARQHERAVVFLDETEALVAKRGGDSTVMNRVIPEFLAQVDGLEGRHGGMLLLGATNRPWDMDEAALRPGRFGELVYVPLPDTAARRAILAAQLAGIPLDPTIDMDRLADETQGLSGADLVGLCELMKDAPYEREIETSLPQCLEPADVDAALRSARRSIPDALLQRFEKFRAPAPNRSKQA